MDLSNIGADEGGVAVLTIGLVQLIKPYIPSNYTPLASVGVAILTSVLFNFSTKGDWVQAILSGLVVGLSASGLYDAGKGIKTSFAK